MILLLLIPFCIIGTSLSFLIFRYAVSVFFDKRDKDIVNSFKKPLEAIKTTLNF